MVLYLLNISCVDGLTLYSCGGEPKIVLEFLSRYNHEGSSLTLTKHVINGSPAEIEEQEIDTESIYDELKRASELESPDTIP